MSAIEERLTALERRANRYRNTAVMIVVLVLSVGVGAAHTMSLIFKALQVFIGHAAAALLHVCTSAARSDWAWLDAIEGKFSGDFFAEGRKQQE